MKKFLKKAILIFILFAIVLGGAITYNWYKNREIITYTSMSRATLPVVTLSYKEGCSNSFYGYTDEMEYRTMRAAITPLSDRHRLNVSIDSYGKTIDQVIYQLRSLDGSRLVEDGVMDKWTEADGIMTQELQLANLMEDGREYTLVFFIKQGEKTTRYYSRVIYMKENHTDTMLQFVYDFSQATYTGNESMIVNYIQPNDSMTMDDLSYINIHSRYRMFTWSNLNPIITGEIETDISELSDSQMTVTLHYPVSIESGDITKHCEVEENFVVRFRNDTMYLLDYERYLTETFSFSRMQFDNGNIWLGITSENIDAMLSPNQKIQAFAYLGQLWSYDNEKETMSAVFSYHDGEDKRGKQDRHSIELVRVTDEGNIDFIVYGYHNRGQHEGQVGVCFYRYLKAENKMEELFYIPSTISEDVLQTEMGGLAYVSDTELLYFLYGTTMYSVDLTSREKMELATQDSTDGFYSNKDASIVAWHEKNAGMSDKIAVMNLKNGQLFRIEAKEGEFFKIQGFIGDDIVYGIGKLTDKGVLAGVQEIQPLYALKFMTVGDTLEESGIYEQSGICITETQLADNEVEITRVHKNGAAYVPADTDYVFLNERETVNTTGNIKKKIDETFLKECYISLNVEPIHVVFETTPCQYKEAVTENILTAASALEDDQRYYVYGKGKLLDAYETLADAIELAYDVMGSVTDGNQNYLWTRGTRDLFKNLTLEPSVCESETQSLRAALEMVLSFEGASAAGLEAELLEGKTITEVLSKRLNGPVLDLTGCSVSQILYYLHKGHPVIAQTREEAAVLIVGYETSGITVYNPYNGTTMQMSMAEAESYFGGLGYRFFSCL